MAEPVIHVTPEAHEIVKAYCRRRNFRMIDWASATLIEAVGSTVVKVRQRQIEQLDTTETGAAEQPPFWANRERKKR
jgi:hypothetical protein